MSPHRPGPMALPLLLASLLTASCTAEAPQSSGSTPAPGSEGAAMCEATPAQARLGQTATAELGAELLRLTGARTLRWVAPGMAVTMDFRPDRLTVSYDANSHITRISCG